MGNGCEAVAMGWGGGDGGKPAAGEAKIGNDGARATKQFALSMASTPSSVDTCANVVGDIWCEQR